MKGKGKKGMYDEFGLPCLGKQTVDYFGMLIIKDLFSPFERLQLMAKTPLERAELVLVRAYEKSYEEKTEKDKQKISHAFRVSNCLETEEEKIVALFHEGPEEGIIQLKDLSDLGLSQEGLEAIEVLMSDEKRYPNYVDFIKALISSKNLIALRVKKASLLDKNNQIINDSNLDANEKKQIIQKRNRYIERIEMTIQMIQLETLKEQIALQEASICPSI